MKAIPLSATNRCQNSGKYLALVDEIDFEFLSQWKWFASVRAGAATPYVRARRNNRSGHGPATINMHVAIWERANGPVPVGMTVDHIHHGDFGALDNRRSNFRLASRKDQQGNRRKGKGCSSQFRGVSRHAKTGRWTAFIVIDTRTRNLGTFDSELAAARAYDSAARKHFGEFANLNEGAA